MQIYHILSNQSHVDGCLGGFQYFIPMDNPIMKKLKKKPFCESMIILVISTVKGRIVIQAQVYLKSVKFCQIRSGTNYTPTGNV